MKTENGNGNRIIRKRIKSAIICLLMALSLAVSNFAGLNLGGVKAHAALQNGDGSSDNPYQITSYEDLVEFANVVDGEGVPKNTTACAILMDNIECKYTGSDDYDTNWYMWEEYNGTFDGQGFKIIGLNNSSIKFGGLFNKIGSSGKVKNVGIVDGQIYSSSVGVGGIARYNEGEITDCYFMGMVIGSEQVGGVVGYNSGTITGCYNMGKITGSKKVGGVIGENLLAGTIMGCYNTGEVTATGENSEVGGIIGYGFSNYSIENCYNTGNVTGNKNVGGVCGYINAKIKNSYNTGNVIGTENVGGVIGYSREEIKNTYNTGNVIGTTNVGGVSGYSRGEIKNTYNTGNVRGTTNVGGVLGYLYSAETRNCYNTGIVIGTTNVGGVVGNIDDSVFQASNCYYDITRCMVAKAIGNAESDTETVKGLTTTQMTGSNALSSSNMEFSDFEDLEEMWIIKADSSNDDTSYWYYPHLKGFNFDMDNQQMVAANISADKWPAKITTNIIPSGDLSVAYNGDEQELPGYVVQNVVEVPADASVLYRKYANGSFDEEVTGVPTDPGVYEVEFSKNNATIGIYTFTILAEGTDKDYTISYQKKTGGDSGSGEACWTNISSLKNVGDYKAIVSFTAKSNEKIEKEFKIAPKSIAVTANSGSKVYGDAEPSLTYTSDTLCGNDSFSGCLSRISGENTGEYDIEINTLSAGGNYNIKYTGAKFTITPKALGSDAIRLSNEEYEYDGTAKTPEVFVYDGNNKIPDSEFTYRILNNLNAGTATVEVSDAVNGNYTVKGTKTFKIKEAEVTVTANDISKAYGEKDPVYTATIKGLKEKDTVNAITYTFSRTEGEDTGTYVVTPSGNEIQGNYKVSYVPGTLVINKKLAGIKTAPAAFTGLKYSGNEQALIQAGTAEDSCTILYALGKNASDVPAADTEGTPEAEKKWKSAVPSGKNAGTYYVWYKIASDTNHTGTEAACIPVTISKEDPEYIVPTGLKIETGKKLSDVALPEHWSWADSGQSVGNAGSNTFKAVYTPVDTDNYNVVNSIDVTVEVTEPEPDSKPQPDPVIPTPIVTSVPEEPDTGSKTVTNNDGSTTTTTKTKNEDGTITESTIREWKNGDKNITEVIKDADGNTLSTLVGTVRITKKGTKTEKTDIRKADGFHSNSSVKTYKSGKEVTSSSTTFANGSKQAYSETKNADGTLTRKIMDTNTKGVSTLTVTTVVWGEDDSDTTGTPDGNDSEDTRKLVKTVTKYKVTGDGKIRLTSIKTEGDTAIIPKTVTFDGQKNMIVSLGKGLFKGMEGIKEIYIYAENLKKIYAGAFNGVPADAKFFIKATTTNCKKIARMIQKSGFGKVDYTKI